MGFQTKSSTFIDEFLSSVVDPTLEALKKFSSSERQVYCKITSERSSELASGNSVIELKSSRKNYRKLNSKQKWCLFVLLSFLKYYRKKEVSEYYYLLIELEAWIEKDLQNVDYFTVAHKLGETYQCKYLLELYTTKEYMKRYLFSEFLGKNSSQIDQSLLSFLPELFARIRYNKLPKAARKVFRKGYRDHGSLGTEFSKTLKEVTLSDEYQEILRKRDEERDFSDDTIAFIKGWLD